MSDEEDERPSFGGLGFSRGGLGAGFAPAQNAQDEDDENDAGYESPRKRPRLGDMAGFRGGAAAGTGQPKSAPGGSFAARMMASMGWKQGEGLGVQGHGRLAPIDVTLRPQGAGLGAVKEKSKQAKEEEKRAANLRGETLEDSSDEERKRKKAAKEARRRAGAGPGPAPPRPRKPKYVTAEEVKADLDGLDLPENVLKTVYDLTGKQTEEWGVNTGFVAEQAPADPAEVEAQKAAKLIHRELLACAETRHGLNDQRTYLDDSTVSLVRQIDEARENVQISTELVAAIHSLPTHSHTTSSEELPDAIADLTKKFETLEVDHHDHLDRFNLSEVAVAALHPLFRSAMHEWEPLEEPSYLTQELSKLKAILGIVDHSAPAALARKSDLHPEVHRNKRSTTHYETMIYQLWLPRVRSAVTNEFDVEKPQPFIDLLSAWRPLLPMFVYTSMINQLLVPRLESAVRHWKPSRSGKHRRPSLNEIVFPWLSYLPERQLDFEESSNLMSEVRRKLRSQLATHDLKAGVPAWLIPWRTLLGSAYTHLLTTQLLPRLAKYLSDNLIFDLELEKPEALETTLAYAPLLSAQSTAQLLAAEFLPRLNQELYHMLGEPAADLSDIEEWYQGVISLIPRNVQDLAPFAEYNTKATEMISAAYDPNYGVAAISPPSPPPSGHATADADKGRQRPPSPAPASALAEPHGPSYRDTVEEWCAENDLLFVTLGKAHPELGLPLFRITARADQKGGAVVYFRDNKLHVRQGAKDSSPWKQMEPDEALIAKAEGL